MRKTCCSIIATLLLACSVTFTSDSFAFSTQQSTPVYEVGNEEQARILDVPGISNFRDIGGYQTTDGQTVKWGHVYRSGELSRVSNVTQAALNTLYLDTIIDFRSDEERDRSPSRWVDDATKPETLLLTIGGNAADWSSKLSRQIQSGAFTAQEIHQTFIETYRAIPQENTDEYAAMFDEILENDGPVLIHCTAGKDRTGIGAALILSALDVPRDTIMQDFMLTNDAVDLERMLPLLAKIFGRQSGKDINPEAIRPLAAVDAVFLETTFQAIEDSHGDIDTYLNEALGLNDAKRKRLKEILLTD